MWKHKNFINLQLCGFAPTKTIYVYVNGTSITLTTFNEIWADSQEYNTNFYSISGNTVVWQDGKILQYNGVDVLPTDTIVYDGQYTTRTATQKLPTPTNVSITNTTVQWDEVANATSYDVLVDGEVWENVPQPITSETWVLNNTLTLENIPLYNIPFTSGGQSYEGMEVSIDSGGSGYVRYSKDGLQYGSYEEVYTKDGPMDGWNNSKWRTIVYPAPVTDVTLLPWLQANGTKQ